MFNPAAGALNETLQAYRDNAHADAVRLSGEIRGEIAFLNINGRLYMVRNLLGKTLPFTVQTVVSIDQPVVFGDQLDGFCAGTDVRVIELRDDVSRDCQAPLAVPH